MPADDIGIRVLHVIVRDLVPEALPLVQEIHSCQSEREGPEVLGQGHVPETFWSPVSLGVASEEVVGQFGIDFPISS